MKRESSSKIYIGEDMKKIVLIFFFLTLISIGIYLHIHLNKNKISFHEVNLTIEETEHNKAIVSTPKELIEALESSNIEIIEIIADLDLGYNLIKEEIDSPYIEEHTVPLTHPILKKTGVSNLKIQNKNHLIIYSKDGRKILHTNIRILDSQNIKIENIKMEELWEWDEETKAEYDRNDWDYITIQNSENIQIKNCEFSKSYDGITDIKNSKNITIQYCKVNEIDIENDVFFNQQFEELEKNKEKYPMYNYLRMIGLSTDTIKKLSSHQFKLYLIGPQDNDPPNENIVIHDSMYLNVKTRIPLARNSSVYLYNIYFDASKITPNMVTTEQLKILKKDYPKIVALYGYGPISIQGSYVVVKNCIFEGVTHKYTFARGLSLHNLGKIEVHEDKEKLIHLEENLERIVGNRVMKE